MVIEVQKSQKLHHRKMEKKILDMIEKYKGKDKKEISKTMNLLDDTNKTTI